MNKKLLRQPATLSYSDSWGGRIKYPLIQFPDEAADIRRVAKAVKAAYAAAAAAAAVAAVASHDDETLIGRRALTKSGENQECVKKLIICSCRWCWNTRAKRDTLKETSQGLEEPRLHNSSVSFMVSGISLSYSGILLCLCKILSTKQFGPDLKIISSGCQRTGTSCPSQTSFCYHTRK